MSAGVSSRLLQAQALPAWRRAVLKVGSSLLAADGGGLTTRYAQALAGFIAASRAAGRQVVLVSSGAVAAGRALLRQHVPAGGDLAARQALAALGQAPMIALWQSLSPGPVAQVLLTHDDLQHHERHLNARNTLVTLLKFGVIPIINENDAISFTELKFGDNDKLSALVSALLPADLLVILTTVDGVIENFGKPNARVLSTIEKIDSDLEKEASGTTSETAVGGMTSKIQAAKIVARSGIPLVIAPGRNSKVLTDIVRGGNVGTLFIPRKTRLSSRKRWIAFFHSPHGTIYVDDGCKQALREKGKSLLPPGVKKCDGHFSAGEVVRVCDLNGTEFARGITFFNSEALNSGDLPRTEVIQRDNLVIL